MATKKFIQLREVMKFQMGDFYFSNGKILIGGEGLINPPPPS